MKTWKTISSKKILDHKRLTVFEDQVELPNGQVTDYVHFGNDKGSVAIIAINDEGKILLQKEYNYPPNQWLFQFPGGRIDNNEHPEAAAIRELSEEAKITGKFEFLSKYFVDNRKRRDEQFVFVCTQLASKKGVQDLEEVFEEHWLSPAEINELILAGQLNTAASLAAWMQYSILRSQ